MPQPDIDRVVTLLRDAEKIAALTGAGISTDSGIPDFRGPQGVWTRNPAAEKQATLQTYLADPDVRRRAWQARKSHGAWTAQPNSGHHALVDLERAGKLRAVATQNVDGLHQRAGSSAERVIELHGTVWFAQCVACGDRTPMAETLERVSDELPDPPCERCGGILKSATISFGQALDPEVLERAWQAAADCDLMLAIGSTLQVHPAAGLCDVAVGHGARLVILNADPTPYDAMATVVLRARIGEVLPDVVRAALSPS
ncbi:MAG TPA: Sir2 family NAD-dependent protein deacetylase [Mycobacteriales bacterium]|jgi:NAD-dependent deacetylase|nr:Sir2 family NAD-dependent protein deacetylase [Mycobacteriales bacterium]